MIVGAALVSAAPQDANDADVDAAAAAVVAVAAVAVADGSKAANQVIMCPRIQII